MTYLTTRDIQDLIRVDKSTIYRMAEDGRLPAIKVGRQWRFPEQAIRQMLGRLPEPEVAAGGGPEPLLAKVDRSTLRSIADLAAEVTGTMVVLTTMDGVPLLDVVNPCGLFSAVAPIDAIPECVATWALYGDVPDLAPEFRPSKFGFLCARSFVRVGSELLGMLIVGGVAPENWPPPKDELEAIAESFDIDGVALSEHIDEVYHLDAGQRERVVRLLPRFTLLISQVARDAGRYTGRLDAIASLASEQRST